MRFRRRRRGRQLRGASLGGVARFGKRPACRNDVLIRRFRSMARRVGASQVKGQKLVGGMHVNSAEMLIKCQQGVSATQVCYPLLPFRVRVNVCMYTYSYYIYNLRSKGSLAMSQLEYFVAKVRQTNRLRHYDDIIQHSRNINRCRLQVKVFSHLMPPPEGILL